LFREYKNVITGVTFWGVADDMTWLDYFPVPGRKNWPLLFDENHEEKQAFRNITDF
jgi:endo-1,4-beta-xylanase